MKTLKIAIPSLLSIAFVVFFSCTTSDESANNLQNSEEKTTINSQINQRNSGLKVLPLGDSRVEGNTSNSVSYRYFLWKNLVQAGFNFDFIGTQNDSSNYPSLNTRTFDPDHQGIGGFRTTDVLTYLDAIIDTVGGPDIVLLGIGGNDLVANVPVEDVIQNIKVIIYRLRLASPKVTIFLEKIAPANSSLMNASNTAIYNHFITEIEDLASTLNNSSSKIIAVDMSSDWYDSYLLDNFHYSDRGAKQVGLRYYLAFKEHILN